MADMSTYLTTKSADHSGTLSVTPQTILTEEGKKNQVVHEFDDGEVEVVAMAAVYFNVYLQWDIIGSADRDSIMDMYFNAAKADGFKKTFYWQHPLDGNVYVARFMSIVNIQHEVSKPNYFSVPKVNLRVTGVKAA